MVATSVFGAVIVIKSRIGVSLLLQHGRKASGILPFVFSAGSGLSLSRRGKNYPEHNRSLTCDVRRRKTIPQGLHNSDDHALPGLLGTAYRRGRICFEAAPHACLSVVWQCVAPGQSQHSRRPIPARLQIMSERWRTIPNFPAYMVSDQGRVYSHKTQKYLQPGIASNGYPTVALGRGNTRTLHSLVAEAFIGSCPKGQEVRHRDGVRTNPNLTNLRYGTRSENIRDAYKHGTRSKEKDRFINKKAVATRDSNDPDWRSKQFKNIDRKSFSQKVTATKDARYGRKNWTALQRAGVAYSKKGGTAA